MPNRFNRILNTPYVNTYVPLPIQDMKEMMAMKQGQFDKAQQSLASETEPLAKYDVSGAIKTYGDKGIQDIDLGNQARKTQIINDIAAKRDKLAQDMMEGKIAANSPEQFRLHNEALKAAQELQGLETEAKQIKEANKKFLDSEDYARGTYTGHALLDYNKKYLAQKARGETPVYNPVGIGKYVEMDKAVSAYAQGVGEDTQKAYIGTDKRPGYIYEYSEDGRSENKIAKHFEGWYNNSEVKSAVKSKVAQDLAIAGLKASDPYTFEVPVYDKNNKQTGTKKMTTTYENYLEAQAKQDLLDQAMSHSTSKITQSQGTDQWAVMAHEEAKAAETRTYDTALGKMGEQGIAAMSQALENEPSNSILAKVINFFNPNSQANGLLNIYRVMNPSAAYNPSVMNLQAKLEKGANASEDEIQEGMKKVGYELKQKIAGDQKDFRSTFGFGNFAYDQAYNMVDFLTSHKEVEENADYKRAKAVVSAQDPNFDKLDKKDQFKAVSKAMGDFVESSKLNQVLVPADKKESDFRNAQLANVTGTPTEQTKQLMALGVAANGKFIDFQTNKPVLLEDVIKSGQVKYMGSLKNGNQFGPAMDYYQGADGKFYVSPGSLEDRSANYTGWLLEQPNNKFDGKIEAPLSFDASRDSRNFESDGVTPKAGLPKIIVEDDLKTKSRKATIEIDGVKYPVKDLSPMGIEQAKDEIAIKLMKAGTHTAAQTLNLGL